MITEGHNTIKKHMDTESFIAYINSDDICAEIMS